MPWIDLSTGINPVPYPLPVLGPECFARLPEPAATLELEQVAANTYGAASATMVAAGPGTQTLIGLIAQIYAAGEVTILAPTYGDHAPAWHAAGARVRYVSQPRDLGGGAAALCNPNNPDGRALPAAEVIAIARRVAASGGVLVVDEAFADLEDDGLSAVPAVPVPGVIVLRSFGKTYGLAGVRLGFALGAAELLAPLRSALGPWPVSGPAVEIGRAALADSAWRRGARERLGHDATRLEHVLKHAGLSIVGGTRLFRLAKAQDASKVFQRLGEAGIYVRRFAGNPEWLRFGIPGSAAAWDRLEAVLAAS